MQSAKKAARLWQAAFCGSGITYRFRLSECFFEVHFAVFDFLIFTAIERARIAMKAAQAR